MQHKTIGHVPKIKNGPRISVGVVGENASIKDVKTLLDANASEAALATTKKPLIVSIFPGSSLPGLIKSGRYDGFNQQLKRGPAPKAETFECRIFHFDQIIGSTEAQRKIIAADKKNPWKPARIDHMLALGAHFPHLQRQFPITALGTTYKVAGLPQVACLHHGDGPKRYVILRWRGDDWCGDFAFLGVRQIKN